MEAYINFKVYIVINLKLQDKIKLILTDFLLNVVHQILCTQSINFYAIKNRQLKIIFSFLHGRGGDLPIFEFQMLAAMITS